MKDNGASGTHGAAIPTEYERHTPIAFFIPHW